MKITISGKVTNVEITTRELYDKGLLDKLMEIKPYSYPSLEISNMTIVKLTEYEAKELGLISNGKDEQAS